MKGGKDSKNGKQAARSADHISPHEFESEKNQQETKGVAS